MFASPYRAAPATGLGVVLERMLRPAVGFSHPSDVLKDPGLTRDQMRAVLASWASDACAVEDRPGWRLSPGAEHPVHLSEILECLFRLDGQDNPHCLGEAGAS